MRYFMQVFINSVESLNHPVYSAPPCTSSSVVGVIFVDNRSGKYDASKESTHSTSPRTSRSVY